MKPAVGDIVQIDWVDSHGKTPSVDGHFSWVTESELNELLNHTLACETIGKVYKVTDHMIAVISTKAIGTERYESQYGDYVMIPRSAITKIRKLK